MRIERLCSWMRPDYRYTFGLFGRVKGSFVRALERRFSGNFLEPLDLVKNSSDNCPEQGLVTYFSCNSCLELGQVKDSFDSCPEQALVNCSFESSLELVKSSFDKEQEELALEMCFCGDKSLEQRLELSFFFE